MKRFTAILSILTCLSPHSLIAQQPAQGLRVFVLEGADAVNNIRTRQATTPIVEVRDADYLPVAGTDVEFRLPTSGPGGMFPGLTLVYSTKTNAQGQAAAIGFQPNDQPGPFQIRVTATIGGRSGEAIIQQTNSTDDFARVPPKRSHKKLWITLAVAGGAAAAAGIYFGTRNGSSATNTGVISLIPGPVTVGGP